MVKGNGVPGLVGMYNLGNTCYINVIMQCLNNIKTISDFLLHWDMSVYHESFVKNHDGFKLYTTLRSYLAQMSTTNTNVAPLRLVWRNNPSMVIIIFVLKMQLICNFSPDFCFKRSNFISRNNWISLVTLENNGQFSL